MVQVLVVVVERWHYALEVDMVAAEAQQRTTKMMMMMGSDYLVVHWAIRRRNSSGFSFFFCFLVSNFVDNSQQLPNS